MDEKDIRIRLNELAEALSAVPAREVGTTPGSYAAHSPLPVNRSLEDMLDHVRLQAKYVMFDLEATRRENHYLREMIERRPRFGEESDNNGNL
jgi:hypothetical protein